MKNKNEEILNEFKEMLLTMTAHEVHSLLFDLVNPDGYLEKEASKVFDIENHGLSKTEILKRLDEFHELETVQRHVISIISKSTSGKSYEKQIGYLINKIQTLPESWQNGLIEQIKDCTKQRSETLSRTNRIGRILTAQTNLSKLELKRLEVELYQTKNIRLTYDLNS